MFGKIPAARDGHSACVINNSMYIFGGYEEHTDQFSQDVHKLDLKSMEWSYVRTRVSHSHFNVFFTSSFVLTRFYNNFIGRTAELS